MSDISETQSKVLRYLLRRGGMCSVQIAGHGRGPWLSASRALVRKGLAADGARTGFYRLTQIGAVMAKELSEQERTK